jgi:hypothetical protein
MTRLIDTTQYAWRQSGAKIRTRFLFDEVDHALPALRRPHDRGRGLRARLRAETAAATRQDRYVMSQISCERRGFAVPMRWRHAGGALSRPNHADRRAGHRRYGLPTTEVPVGRFQAPLCTHMQVAWCRHRAHHDRRRENQIPIALAAQPAPNFPRLRALALFGRRPPEREGRLLMPAVCNLIIGPLSPSGCRGGVWHAVPNAGLGSLATAWRQSAPAPARQPADDEILF